MGTKQSVSVIIPTRGSRGVIRGSLVRLVDNALESLVRTADAVIAEYVLVHDTDSEADTAFVEQWQRRLGDRFVAVPFDEPFNFSRKINRGARRASGDYLLYLNDDVEALESGWLESMLEVASQPRIGAVGALLEFGDGRVQHAGIAIEGGDVFNIYAGSELIDLSTQVRETRRVSAVTGAALLQRRDVWEACGGWDEALPNNFNDVALCLKLARMGLETWVCGDAVLVHFESQTRTNTVAPYEVDALSRELGSSLWGVDPYSPGLRVASGLAEYGAPPDVSDETRILIKHARFLAQHEATWTIRPRISVLIPTYQPNRNYLREALESVAAQSYSDWEVCVVDDASPDPFAQRVIEEFQAKYLERVRFRRRDGNGNISVASNDCLDLASGDYVALLDHDDRLYPQALSEVVRMLNLLGEGSGSTPEIIYTDEEKIDSWGEVIPGSAFLKPDWSPELHLRCNYTTHLSVYSTQLLRRIGGFRVGYEGAQDHDLMLRAVEAAATDVGHVPQVLYQWRAHSGSTAQAAESKDYAAEAGIRAVSDHLGARDNPAYVELNPHTGHYRIRYPIPEPHPLVSIIIPSRDARSALSRCVESVLSKTQYEHFEIVIVDNGTKDPDALQLLESFHGSPNVRVIKDPAYFNFARLCNAGARAARGEYVLLLNNDTEVLEGDWLTHLLGLACQPGIGAVGPTIIGRDAKIQHAGVALIGHLVADHFGRGYAIDSRAYSSMMQNVHEVSAVTGACLMVNRQMYDAVGGLDELHVPNGYGDVDFCLELRRRGLRNLHVPDAVVVHDESHSRGRNVEIYERDYMRRKWAAELASDPYLNPGLARSGRYVAEPSLQHPAYQPGAHRA